VIVKVERSGGFAGMSNSHQIDSRDLPSSLIIKLNRIIENTNADKLPIQSTPRGASDFYSYKISIQDGANQKVLERNQYDIDDDLRSLIRYIESNSKKG